MQIACERWRIGASSRGLLKRRAGPRRRQSARARPRVSLRKRALRDRSIHWWSIIVTRLPGASRPVRFGLRFFGASVAGFLWSVLSVLSGFRKRCARKGVVVGFWGLCGKFRLRCVSLSRVYCGKLVRVVQETIEKGIKCYADMLKMLKRK